jgi:hypothetical protein
MISKNRPGRAVRRDRNDILASLAAVSKYDVWTVGGQRYFSKMLQSITVAHWNGVHWMVAEGPAPSW